MNLALDPTTVALTELAQGQLAPAARRALAQRALRDPQLAEQLKLALRLADGSADLTQSWVRVASTAEHQAQAAWWRPLAGACASLAIVAAVMMMPRSAPMPGPGVVDVASMQQSLPDQIGSVSFEAPELFGGSFEAN